MIKYLYPIVSYKLATSPKLKKALPFIILALAMSLLSADFSYNLISSVKEKAVTTYNFGKYTVRTLLHEEKSDAEVIEPLHRMWATIAGLNNKGEIVLRVWGNPLDDEHQKNESMDDMAWVIAELSDLNITDIPKAALIVKGLARQQVEVDYYRYTLKGEVHNSVVVWLPSGELLNNILIEENASIPHKKPPTNVINKLMMTYYLEKLL